MKKSALSILAAVSATTLLVTSCSKPADEQAPANDAATESHEHEGHDHEHDHEGHHHEHDGMEADEGETEVAQLPNRVVISHEGGLKTYDAKTGKVQRWR